MTTIGIYVSCADARAIEVFAFDGQQGNVSLRQRMQLSGRPSPLRIAPLAQRLLVGTRDDNALYTYAIDGASGELTFLANLPLPGGPTYIGCDAAARRAWVASYSDNLLLNIALNEQGHPLPDLQIEAGLSKAHAAVPDPGGQWLAVPVLGADAIRLYRRADDGRLMVAPLPLWLGRPGSGPRHLAFSSTGGYAYCINELEGSVDVLNFDAAAGQLSLLQSVSIMPPGFEGTPWAAEIRLAPGGGFLYTTERRTNTLSVFAVDPDNGRLSPLGCYPTENQPRGMAIEPGGRWLAVIGQLSSCLTIYALHPETGAPQALCSTSVGVGPIGVEMMELG